MSVWRRIGRRPGTVAAGVALALVAFSACTVPVATSSTSSPTSTATAALAATAGSTGTVQVTVPGLGGSAPTASSPASSGPAPTGGSSAPASLLPVTSTVTATATGSVTSGSSGSSSSASTASAAVRVASCGGCTVLASARSVAGEYSAALVTVAGGRGALLSVRSDGSTGSARAITYGTSVTPPADGVLPCDSAGRCLVIGKQANGKAVVAAFQLAATGSWTDLTISGGFRSDTAAAQILDLDGEPGIAVQTQGGIWLVYGWDSDTYNPVGCTPSGASADVSRLSMSICPS